MTDDTAPGAFLRRWSARKLAGGDAEVEPVPRASEATGAPAPEDGKAAAAAAAGPDGQAADLPDVASLGRDSDYRPFLSPEVSEHLRRRALRKLFHLPDFNVTDGLDDYDEDYTGTGGVLHLAREGLERLAGRGVGQALDPGQDTAEAVPGRGRTPTGDGAGTVADAPREPEGAATGRAGGREEDA